ncbi:MAG: RidA family protein [Phycisphaeraceae bacterium]|nr:RidA family protein [Phycisphaeraceae bacterium]MCW5754965.1 RidA family protein [Phycisphaeraceae bacterium]
MTAIQHPEARLHTLGLTLPQPARPVASYIPVVRSGDLVFVSGQIPLRDGQMIAQGRVGREVDQETALECARQCTLNGLAALRAEIGSLDRVRRVVRVGCFVACDAGFHAQPAIANGASNLLVEIFGESGRHARAAVGCIDLPLGAPVEVEFLFQVDPD